MNYQPILRVLPLLLILSAVGCTTVVEKEPTVTSTTVTEETRATSPLRQSTTTETTTLHSR